MEQSVAASSAESSTRQCESTYGVQSLADTLEAAFGSESRTTYTAADNGCGQASNDEDSARRSSQSPPRASRKDLDSSKMCPVRTHKRNTSLQSVSNPLTPQHPDSRSPVPASAMPSTPRSVSLQSLKLSDEEPASDEVASQAITSSGDEDEEDPAQDESGTFPQLVMPSIQMPSRRPFTSKGKAMGKLKVLVAGEAGMSRRSPVTIREDNSNRA